MARTKQFDEQDTLQKATELFWQKGFCATSMQELVDCMGINRASMYSTYGDKNQLFADALQKYHEENFKAINELIAEPISAREKLNRLLGLNVTDCCADKQQKGCFMVNTAVEMHSIDEHAAELVRKNLEVFTKALETIITQGQKEKEITDKFPAATLANFLVSTTNGMKVTSRLGLDAKHFQQITDVINGVLFL